MLSPHSLLQVYGDDNVVALLKQLQPSVIIPFMNAEMQVSLVLGCALSAPCTVTAPSDAGAFVELVREPQFCMPLHC